MFVSEYVHAEAAGGNLEAAAKRLNVIQFIPILETTHLVREVAEALLNSGALTRQAEFDAYHIAIAVTHDMEYLLTWNCTHIANAVMRQKIEVTCSDMSYDPPIICTPDELTQE